MIIEKDTEIFREFVNIVVQRYPRYTVKQINDKRWKTKNKCLVDTPVKAHLQGKYHVGVLGKWYPEYCILDMDNVLREEPERIKDILRVDELGSMLCSSGSPDSYHILLRPTYNNKPPTLRLLHNAFKIFGKQNNIEIYPQANKTIKIPFGYGQDCLDFDYINLKNWQEKFNWFLKLNDFNLSGIPYHQPELDLKIENPGQPNTYKEGEYLLKYGLQAKSSRNESQYKMLYYLWRKNTPQSIAIDIVWKVIKEKHNNFSKDIITNPGECRKEIIRQAGIIYNTYEFASVYPDETHNIYGGFITKGDIADIVRINPKLSRIRYLYHIVKYCNPRRYRYLINVHSDKLIEWSSRENYLKYIDELFRPGIIKRCGSYSVDRFSKSIKIKWNYRDPDNAILDDGRAPNTLEETLQLSFKPEEFRELLKNAGSERTTAIEIVKRIYEGVKN
ncbi:hypothetical protein ES708_26027 [subsurface metagenome]|jgi:hypothetical protein